MNANLLKITKVLGIIVGTAILLALFGPMAKALRWPFLVLGVAGVALDYYNVLKIPRWISLTAVGFFVASWFMGVIWWFFLPASILVLVYFAWEYFGEYLTEFFLNNPKHEFLGILALIGASALTLGLFDLADKELRWPMLVIAGIGFVLKYAKIWEEVPFWLVILSLVLFGASFIMGLIWWFFLPVAFLAILYFANKCFGEEAKGFFSDLS